MRNVNGIVIPSTIRICAQLIKCPKIVNRSKPNKYSHCGVDLSAINQLSISYYYDVEPSTLKCEKLSDPFEILTLCFDT
ncbi:unnamed protein product, partial [Anisakis simplex]|uniref:Uncharacterized protein n=1 Tax=Anisakis simplex TaxID=6269 RepID=A0A0M3JKE3_ANISI